MNEYEILKVFACHTDCREIFANDEPVLYPLPKDLDLKTIRLVALGLSAQTIGSAYECWEVKYTWKNQEYIWTDDDSFKEAFK